MAKSLAKDMHDAARKSVAGHARHALADSPLYGRELAMSFALAWAEPLASEPASVTAAKLRGVFAGLRDAGVLPELPSPATVTTAHVLDDARSFGRLTGP